MAYCEFSQDFVLLDATPVENVFLMEYLPNAPGDYVRVYLYCRMLCGHPTRDSSADTVAKALGLKPEEVNDALRYWEQKGLVVRMTDRPPTYQFIHPHRVMLHDEEPMDGAYRYRDFFQKLQSIFGSERLLAPQEQAKAIDWLETLNLPEDVVLRMVEAHVQRAKDMRRSMRFIFRDLDAVALKWASEDIRTMEAAEEWLTREGAAAQAARLVLRHMGLRRVPTLEEIKLAETWVREWDLSQADIVSACAELTKTANPSFAYLHTILAGRRPGAEKEYFADIKRILDALGSYGRPTPAQEEIYLRLQSAGFDLDTMAYAAGQCSKRGKHTFEDLEQKLETWKQSGITTREAAEQFARSREPAERLMGQVYEQLGLNGRPARKEVTQMIEWMRVFPEEVVLFAAERSVGFLKPVLYMQKILSNWQIRGAVTLEAARVASAEFDNTAAPEKKTGKKINPAQQYEQRTYDDDAMKHLLVDPMKLPGDDEP